MAHRPIVLQFDDDDAPESGWLQPLAGELVWCDRPLTHDAARAEASARPQAARNQEWTPIYDGPGLLFGRLERIRSARGDLGSYRVEHEDGETFLIDGDGGGIRRIAAGTGELTVERALGAPLALALACRGTYLLHASALLRRDGSVIALTAESGGGKSTLAAAAARHPELGLTRLADDQLPVRLGREPAALPHFPQPKLRAGEQYARTNPSSLALRALVEIEVAVDLAAPDLLRVAPPAAIQSLVAATVAAKLFDRELLARHFDACAAAALELPVYRLRYPYGLDRLGKALAALARLPD